MRNYKKLRKPCHLTFADLASFEYVCTDEGVRIYFRFTSRGCIRVGYKDNSVFYVSVRAAK